MGVDLTIVLRACHGPYRRVASGAAMSRVRCRPAKPSSLEPAKGRA